MKVVVVLAVLALCLFSASAGTCPGDATWKKVLDKAAAGKFMFVEVDDTIEVVASDSLNIERAKKPPKPAHRPTAPPASKKPTSKSSSSSSSKQTPDKPGKISFEPHVSGVKDSATSKQNVVDASKGLEASRSSYQKAPGGKVCLSEKVANLLLKLLEKGDVRISELAGGSHSATSGHYAGNSVDITSFKGEYLTKSAKNVKAVVDACRAAGSTAVYHASLGTDKTNAEHKTHVHCQFGPNYKPVGKSQSSKSTSKPANTGNKKPATTGNKKPATGNKKPGSKK